MTEKVPNPQTNEAALEELIQTAEIFDPRMVGEKMVRDENGNLTYKKVYAGDYPRSAFKEPMMVIVGANADFKDNTIGLNEQEARLSLQDYQSVCVERNIAYTTKKLISLCAQGQSEEADKIMPGFFEKYQSAVKTGNGGATYFVEGDVYKQMTAEIRQNFTQIHPDFLEITAAKRQGDRQKLNIPEDENIAVSDAAYFYLTTGRYVLPSEENDLLFAQKRQENDWTVQQMRDQEFRDMSENDKDNTRDFDQRIANNEDIKQVTDDLLNTTLPNEASERLASLDNVDNELEAAAKEFIGEAISNTPSDLQQKYGFDITYDPRRGKFFRKQDGQMKTVLLESDYNREVWNDEHLDNMLYKFSDDTEFNDVNINLYDALKDKNSLQFMSYDQDTNSVYINHYNIPEGKRDDCIELVMQQYDVTKELAEKAIDALTSKDINERMMMLEHEISHRDDDKKFGIFQYDIPPEYMAKLNMLTEIKANMVEASYALDMYEATGNAKYFDTLSLRPDDVAELKETLEKNSDMEGRREFVAKFVYDKWLEQNNQEGKVYSEQAYDVASPTTNSYPIWALQDNPQALAQYHERASAMFENVLGFGDVRKIANPDFELNEDLSMRLAFDNIMRNDALRELMTKDAQNAEQYAANIMAYLKKVKEADADGIRSQEEIAQLDAYLQQITQPQTERPADEGPNFAVSAAKRKSRGGR